MEKFEQFELALKWFNGFLSDDPNIVYFEKGTCKSTFSIPLKKNKDDETTWLNCTAWNQLAEHVSEVYKKGSKVTIGGYFEERDYNGKHYVEFIVQVIS